MIYRYWDIDTYIVIYILLMIYRYWNTDTYIVIYIYIYNEI